VCALTVPNDAALPAPGGRAEQNPARIWAAVREALASLADESPDRVSAVACTGQMHGVMVVDERLEPVSPLVTWQDRRADTLAVEANARLDELDGRGWIGRGCRLHPGYGGLTLAWQAREAAIPRGARWACTISDWIAARLSGTLATDYSNAASWGLFAAGRRDWDRGAVGALGIPLEMLPPLRESGELLGRARLGALGSEVPVACGLGDNQASVLAAISGLPPEDCCVVNVGTGAQISVVSDTPAGGVTALEPPLEVRPFVEGKSLHVGASLNGGAAYAVLRRFLAEAGGEHAEADDLFAAMNSWAASVPPGCDGLVCDPAFAGERGREDLTGSLSGITPRNLTPGHLCRAVLEGMARTLHRFYRSAGLPKRVLVGSGNAVRMNGLFREILSSTFGLPLRVSEHTEEAAVGAALVAARVGELRGRATGPGGH